MHRHMELKKILTISREEQIEGAKMAGLKHLKFIRDLLTLSLVLA